MSILRIASVADLERSQVKPRPFRPSRALTALILLGLLPVIPASALESRSYVLAYFALAMNPTTKDCPGVPDGSALEIARANLLAQGVKAKEAERRAKAFNEFVLIHMLGDNKELEKISADFTTKRAQIDGKPADPYRNPFAAPNPKVPGSVNRMQYGFNLDGKGADDKNSIEDPETHERGIDNQYARAFGCFVDYRGKTEAREPGGGPDSGNYWKENRAGNRATLITIIGDDLSKDGNVIVLLRRSLDAPLLNGQEEPEPDVTYRIDPDRRTLNIFRAAIKNGVLNSLEPVDSWIVSEPVSNFDYKLLNSRLRLTLKPDGIRGLLGGYRPYRDIYAPFAVVPTMFEFSMTINVVALYYNLHDYADGFPDKNGTNRAISSAYRFDGVPAFVVGPDGSPETAQALQSYRNKVASQSEMHRASFLERMNESDAALLAGPK